MLTKCHKLFEGDREQRNEFKKKNSRNTMKRIRVEISLPETTLNRGNASRNNNNNVKCDRIKMHGK